MSEVHVEDHSTAIRTPQKLILVVLLGLLVPILLIVMIVQMVTGGLRVDTDNRAMSEDAVAQRLKPVGEVALAEATLTAPATQAAVSSGKSDGSKVYQIVCAACHGAGLAGAPKLGDKAAWKARLAQGLSTLHEHAIKGIRAMPAKGANPSLSDPEVSAAVDYMVSQSK